MRILVTFALENEFAPWRSLAEVSPGEMGRGGCLSSLKSAGQRWGLC